MADVGNPKVKISSEPVDKGAVVEVKTLLTHPMESGLRKDPNSGETVPAHFVEEVVVTYLGKEIIRSQWTGGISKNPFFSFKLKATASGPVQVTWKDNKGESFTETAQVAVK
ncbi:MAG: thiosulfate oxidation carrier complex protein SoxZ [Magnetococcales bacterium]|nr:thiosulfate oxidation carrier complex protein SoxZ [Magnetococcales bacterium]